MEFEFIFGPNQELLEVSRYLLDLSSCEKSDFLKVPGIYPKIFHPRTLPYAQKRFYLFMEIGPRLNDFLRDTRILVDLELNGHLWQLSSCVTILGTKYAKGFYARARTLEPHPAGEILRMISPVLPA